MPENVNGRVKVKLVYVVLEAQYQSAVTAAVKNINAKNSKVGGLLGTTNRSLVSCGV